MINPARIRETLQRRARWIAGGDRCWHLLSWLGFVALLGLIARFGTDAGVSYDEDLQRTYGELILAWFRSGFSDARATGYFDLFLYGGLFDAPAQVIVALSPLDPYDTRHLLTAGVALLGIVATWKLAACVGGPRAGFFAALILTLTPCWIGHGLFNPKDIPFGTATAFASLSALRIAVGPAPVRLRDACWAGVTAGIALGVRPGGTFALGYPCLAVALRLALELVRRRRCGERLAVRALVGNFAGCIALIAALAWPIMLAAWPWAQQSPFDRPFEAMRVARHFAWGGRVLFEGRTLAADRLPLRYLPVWFRITLPETYFLAALAGAGLLAVALRRYRAAMHGSIESAQPAFTRMKRDAELLLDRVVSGERLRPVIGASMLSAFILLPLAGIFITRPVLYDAQRHVLFLLPPAAAVAGWILSEVLTTALLPRVVRGTCAALLAGCTLLVCVDIVQLHPYEYVYFNRASGGLPKLYKKFETDYWSISYREGFEWVVRELPPVHPRRRTRVASCDEVGNERLNHYRDRWGVGKQVRVVDDYESADVYLAVRRSRCHRVPGEVLHVVRRQGVPLLYVRRTKPEE